MKDKDLLKLLKKNEKTTVVPLHSKDVPVGLLNRILKEAELKKFASL